MSVDPAAIAVRLAAVTAEIEHAAANARRAPPVLLAVSKRHPISAIRAAYNAGQRDFGENQAQEMVDKMEQTQDLAEIRWHFIGRIQTNKAKLIARAAAVHGVGSARHAHALAKAAAHELPIYLQINVDDEAQKNGVPFADAPATIAEVDAISGLKLRGLMCLPEIGRSRESFSRMQALALDLKRENGRQLELSMGMSADFSDAIAFGATVVRIGTAIFGARQT